MSIIVGQPLSRGVQGPSGSAGTSGGSSFAGGYGRAQAHCGAHVSAGPPRNVAMTRVRLVPESTLCPAFVRSFCDRVGGAGSRACGRLLDAGTGGRRRAAVGRAGFEGRAPESACPRERRSSGLVCPRPARRRSSAPGSRRLPGPPGRRAAGARGVTPRPAGSPRTAPPRRCRAPRPRRGRPGRRSAQRGRRAASAADDQAVCVLGPHRAGGSVERGGMIMAGEDSRARGSMVAIGARVSPGSACARQRRARMGLGTHAGTSRTPRAPRPAVVASLASAPGDRGAAPPSCPRRPRGCILSHAAAGDQDPVGVAQRRGRRRRPGGRRPGRRRCRVRSAPRTSRRASRSLRCRTGTGWASAAAGGPVGRARRSMPARSSAVRAFRGRRWAGRQMPCAVRVIAVPAWAISCAGDSFAGRSRRRCVRASLLPPSGTIDAMCGGRSRARMGCPAGRWRPERAAARARRQGRRAGWRDRSRRSRPRRQAELDLRVPVPSSGLRARPAGHRERAREQRLRGPSRTTRERGCARQSRTTRERGCARRLRRQRDAIGGGASHLSGGTNKGQTPLCGIRRESASRRRRERPRGPPRTASDGPCAPCVRPR